MKTKNRLNLAPARRPSRVLKQRLGLKEVEAEVKKIYVRDEDETSEKEIPSSEEETGQQKEDLSYMMTIGLVTGFAIYTVNMIVMVLMLRKTRTCRP